MALSYTPTLNSKHTRLLPAAPAAVGLLLLLMMMIDGPLDHHHHPSLLPTRPAIALVHARTCFMTSAKLMASSMPGMEEAKSWKNPSCAHSICSKSALSGVGSTSCACGDCVMCVGLTCVVVAGHVPLHVLEAGRALLPCNQACSSEPRDSTAFICLSADPPPSTHHRVEVGEALHQ